MLAPFPEDRSRPYPLYHVTTAKLNAVPAIRHMLAHLIPTLVPYERRNEPVSHHASGQFLSRADIKCMLGINVRDIRASDAASLVATWCKE